MDFLAERSYPTPVSNSTLLPLLLLSLAKQRHTPHSSTKIRDEYDFVIVGGGAAGCVVASRLSEESSVNVLLLEAGPEPPFLTEVPALSRYFAGTKLDWQFETIPQKYTGSGLVNRQMELTAGKMLGGSGSLNGMAYVRGNKRDFDNWSAKGAKGWSYDEIFPYFLKLEDNRNIEFLANGYHAVGGPITVEQPRHQSVIKTAVHKAAIELGYQIVDPNAATQVGFYDLQAYIRDSQRCSTVKAYLVPAENRTNLDILLNALVTKVITEEDRATGVEFYSEGQIRRIKAKREVIISAGTVNTPKILMLSGIGPAEELQKFDIPVIADLPVGKNFHNHAEFHYPFTVDPLVRAVEGKLSDPSNIIQYINSRTGPLALVLSLIMAFIPLQGHTELPDYELHFEKTSVSSAKKLINMKPEVLEQFYGPYRNKTIFRCSVNQLRPKSRGTVTLSSRNPFDPPLIDPNYLEVPTDIEDIVEGLKTCKKLLNTAPLLRLGAKPFETLVPGCENYAGNDDEYFRCLARSILFQNHHVAGTSKMGDPADPSTVVDPELRVKNIKGLRVVDASIMPAVISGNTYIPTIMIAEKASDMIKSSISA